MWLFTVLVLLILFITGYLYGVSLGQYIAELIMIFSSRYRFVGFGQHSTLGYVAIFMKSQNEVTFVSSALGKRLVLRFCHAQ